MIGIDYNISTLMREAFGIKGNLAVYKIPDRNQEEININYNGLDVLKPIDDPSQRQSYLGTPILFPMTLKGKKYKVFNYDGNIELDDYADFELPVVSLATFRRAKIIAETKALAANGTVKEMYGFSDWQIDIKGLCLPDPAQPQKLTTAADQKWMLAKYERAVDSIRVSGVLFKDLEINNIVIKELSFSQLKGKPKVIPFTMRCSSDEPLELVL